MVKCEYCGKEINVEDSVAYVLGGEKLFFCREHQGIVSCEFCAKNTDINKAIKMRIRGKRVFFCSLEHLEDFLAGKKSYTC